MSQVITLRLPDAAAEQVRRIAKNDRRSVSDVGARIVEEWLRQDQFAHIEFRSFNGERHACIKERLQVWQVILVAKGCGMDVQQTAQHLLLKPEQVQAALNYYAAYPAEIDQALEENRLGYERLRQRLPGLERITLPPASPQEEEGTR
jgi:uncharacterized protein (DUF433 family)